MSPIIPVVILGLILYVIISLSKHADNDIPETKRATQINNSDYQPKPLLTRYEQLNYQKMKGYAAAHGLSICPKIRLADLIEPRPESNRAIWQKRFNMICSKHVDFVLCDPDMNVKLIVELDDSSHNREDRKARDRFVDAVLTNSGYTIVHIRAFDEIGVAALDSILGPVAPKPAQEEEPQIKIARSGPTYEEWKEQQLAQNHPG